MAGHQMTHVAWSYIQKKPTRQTKFNTRTIKEWNSLPRNIIDIIKIPLFKQALRVNI